MIPAWLLTIRELFPASDAAWLMPILLLFSGSGMPAGGWLAGLLYDRFGFYEAAFLAGLICNLGNLLLVALLVVRCSGGL